MKFKMLILNINDYNSGYGGQATFIKNLHRYLEKEAELRYLIVPDFFTKHHKISLRLIYFFQVLFFMILKKKDYDLIVSHTPEASFVVSLFNKPFVHIFHGNKNALSNSIFWYGKYFKWVFEYFEKRIEKRATKLYTVGEYRENAEKFCNPIDFHIDRLKGLSERRDFVFAGRLEVMKNIDAIIEVYNILPDNIKTENSLHIIGTGTQEKKLKKLAEKLNLGGRIFFHGQIKNEEAIDIIGSSLILFMSSSFEGFPMVIAESLTVGTPVISTDVGDIGSYIINDTNGFLLPLNYERETYVEKIVEIMSDYGRFSLNALKSSRVFNAEDIARKFLSDCREIISIS